MAAEVFEDVVYGGAPRGVGAVELQVVREGVAAGVRVLPAGAGALFVNTAVVVRA